VAKMKIWIVLLLLMISSVFGVNDRLNQFKSWANSHNKNYSQKEFLYRYQIWKTAINKIEKHNSEEHSYKLAMNHFGDLTYSEFLDHIGTRNFPSVDKSKDLPTPLPNDVPSSWDWRDKGAVTQIEDQGGCGSSPYWAAVGAIEGAHVISGQGPLVSLSVQQIVDCTFQVDPYDNEGCWGGEMNSSLEYVQNNNGIDTNASYPYTAQNGNCSYKASAKAAWIDSYVNVPPNENDLLKAILICPVATAVMATTDFQYYTSGVFNDPTCNSDAISHGILVVGYGITTQAEKYWILKNTWTTDWGMQGYMLIERGVDRCGVADNLSYPVIKSTTKN